MALKKSITLSIRLSETDETEQDLMGMIDAYLNNGYSKSEILKLGLMALFEFPMLPPAKGSQGHIEEVIQAAIADVSINPQELAQIQSQLDDIKRFLKNIDRAPGTEQQGHPQANPETTIPDEILRQSVMRRRNKKRGDK